MGHQKDYNLFLCGMHVFFHHCLYFYYKELGGYANIKDHSQSSWVIENYILLQKHQTKEVSCPEISTVEYDWMEHNCY